MSDEELEVRAARDAGIEAAIEEQFFAEGAEPWPERWRCSDCGKEFDVKTRSHAVHMPGCDGSCRSCPIECGPVYEVTAPATGETE